MMLSIAKAPMMTMNTALKLLNKILAQNLVARKKRLSKLKEVLNAGAQRLNARKIIVNVLRLDLPAHLSAYA